MVNSTFCTPCNLSHTQGKGHIYSKKHQEKLEIYLNRQCEKIKSLKYFLKNPIRISHATLPDGTNPNKNFWCFACDCDIDNSKNNFLCFEALKHLSGNKHKRKVEAFWKECGAYLIKDVLKKTKAKFCVGKPKYIEFLRLIKSYDVDEVQEDAPITTDDIQKLYTNSLIPSLSSSTNGKFVPAPSDSKVYKTVKNTLGILQNPTGWNNYERVWGGGIVKFRKEGQWLPWPIDLDDESDQSGQGVMGGWNVQSKPQEEQPRLEILKGIDHNQKIQIQGFGSNLTSLGTISLSPGEGNVHTGATPPWLLDNSGKLRRIPTRSDQRRRNSKQPQKLGWDIIRTGQITAGRNFLPNYGGVWESGSRSESRIKFQEKEKLEEISESAALAKVITIQPTESSLDYYVREVNFSKKDMGKLFM